jgi:hypothetical protein
VHNICFRLAVPDSLNKSVFGSGLRTDKRKSFGIENKTERSETSPLAVRLSFVSASIVLG